MDLGQPQMVRPGSREVGRAQPQAGVPSVKPAVACLCPPVSEGPFAPWPSPGRHITAGLGGRRCPILVSGAPETAPSAGGQCRPEAWPCLESLLLHPTDPGLLTMGQSPPESRLSQGPTTPAPQVSEDWKAGVSAGLDFVLTRGRAWDFLGSPLLSVPLCLADALVSAAGRAPVLWGSVRGFLQRLVAAGTAH